MMTAIVRRQFALAIAAVLGFSIWGGTAVAQSSAPQVVKVGLSSPFSTSEAQMGQDSLHGVQLAISQLKTLNPKVTYDVVQADDECTPSGGASAFGNLIDVQKVDVILGSACSGPTLGGMPLLPRAMIPAITFGSTNPAITQQAGVGGNKYMWRMNIDDSIIGTTFSKYIASAGVKTVAFLGYNNDFGRGAQAVYAVDLPQSGVKLIDSEYYPLDASDLRPQLTKIFSLHPDALLVFGEAKDCALLARQLHELGQRAKVFSRSACYDTEALKLAGDPNLLNGFVEATYWVGTPSQPMIAAYQQMFNVYPPYNAALAYYGMMVIDQAVRAGGPTAAGIERGLSAVNWRSAIGPIKFNDHNQAHPDLFLVTVQNGKPVLLKEVPTQ